MTTKTLSTRLERIEARRRPDVMTIDRVIIGNGAAQPGETVITIGGAWIPNHDNNNTG